VSDSLREVSYGEETLGLLRDLHFLHLLHVVVISDGGWSWVLGWAQLGMKRLVCVSLTEASALEMDRVAAVLQGVDLEPSTWPLVAPGVDGHVVCAHVGVGTPEVLWGLLSSLGSMSMGLQPYVLLSVDRQVLPRLRTIAPTSTSTVELRHRRLGGLTSARVYVAWWGPATDARSKVEPGDRVSPRRPLGTFLEPSAKLREWRMAPPESPSSVWTPHGTDAVPYPWPWTESPRRVRTPSVFG
jgi:hypothetical protein